MSTEKCKTSCECANWARTDGSMTAHHPKCEHYNDSLMDVWEVVIPGESHGCIFDNEISARQEAEFDPDAILEVIPRKMHREVYENLPEFGGF